MSRSGAPSWLKGTKAWPAVAPAPKKPSPASALAHSANAVLAFRRTLPRQPPPPSTAAAPAGHLAATRPAAQPVPNPFIALKNPQSARWHPPRLSLRRQADLVKHARRADLLHLLPPGPKFLPSAHAAAQNTPRVQWDYQQFDYDTAEATLKDRLTKKAAESAKPPVVRKPNAKFSTADDPTPDLGPFLKPGGVLQLARKNFAAKVLAEQGLTRVSLSSPAGPPVPRRLRGEIKWVGELPRKLVARDARLSATGALSRIYFGRKRMFKGHKWERAKPKRIARTAVRMRGMERRVQRFREFYRNRRPSPLATPIPSKRDKLPF